MFFDKNIKSKLHTIWLNKEHLVLNLIFFLVNLFCIKLFKLNLSYSLLSIMTLLISFLLSIMWTIQFKEKFSAFKSLCQQSLHISATFKQEKKFISSFKALDQIIENDQRVSYQACMKSLEEGESNITPFLNFSNHYIFISLIKMMLHYEAFGNENISSVLNILEKDFDVWIDDISKYYEACMDFIRQIILILLLSSLVSIMAQNMLFKTDLVIRNKAYEKMYFYFIVSHSIVYLLAHRVLTEPLILKEETVDKEHN